MLKTKKILREFEVTKKAKMKDDLNTLRDMISCCKGIPVRKQYSHGRDAYTASRTKWLTTKTMKNGCLHGNYQEYRLIQIKL